MSTDAKPVSAVILKNYLDTLKILRANFKPNPAQERLQAAIDRGVKRAVLVWGRKTGKTQGFIQTALEHTATLPYRSGYIIGPTRKQQNEILWKNERVQRQIPDGLKFTSAETDFRIKFDQMKSFIKIDGSEEFASYRGTEYDIMINDEMQDSDPRFYEAAYPNLLARDGLLLVAGTIHSNPQNHFNVLVQALMNDPDTAVIFASSWENAHNVGGGAEWLKREKDKYYKRGDGPLWEREYEARFVFGGKRSVFPTYNVQVRRVPLDVIEAELLRDRSVLKYLEVFDPSQSCFGVLFLAINPFTKQIYILDEIYERDRAQTSTKSIWTRVLEKERKHGISDPLRIYDEAAAWFENEMAQQLNIGMIPSQKQSKSKEDNVSLVKDILGARLLTVNQECAHFDAEMIGYEYDENEVIIKKNDHLVDDLFYGLSVYGYTFSLKAENVDPHDTSQYKRVEPEELGDVEISNELVEVDFNDYH